MCVIEVAGKQYNKKDMVVSVGIDDQTAIRAIGFKLPARIGQRTSHMIDFALKIDRAIDATPWIRDADHWSCQVQVQNQRKSFQACENVLGLVKQGKVYKFRTYAAKTLPS